MSLYQTCGFKEASMSIELDYRNKDYLAYQRQQRGTMVIDSGPKLWVDNGVSLKVKSFDELDLIRKKRRK